MRVRKHVRRETSKELTFTDLVIEIFRLNGRLLVSGDLLTRDLGLTSARWQVLGAIRLAARPLTVAQIARNMGVRRQGVQRIADLLAEQRLLEFVENPDHRSAKLLRLARRGETLLDRVNGRQAQWAKRIADSVGSRQLGDALETVRTIRERLERDRP